MQDEYIRISQAAKMLKVTPQTIRKYAKQGKIASTKTPGGQTIYSLNSIQAYLPQTHPKQNQHKTAQYARSSDGDQKKINTQLEQLEKAYGKPYKTYTDKASGLNENRPGLKRLLKDAKEGKINKLIITQKDRLTRFGYSYLEELFNAYGVEIIVAFDKEDKSLQEELMQDFMSLIASFAGKFYRLRGYDQQKQLLRDAEDKIDDKQKA